VKKNDIVFTMESGAILEITKKGAWFGTSNYYAITKTEAAEIAKILKKWSEEK
jgi:hypothetical protein